MYDLNLTAEQLEMRDTVRDFVQQEIRPVVLHPDWLQQADRPLPLELLDKASQMGLRTLALSEELGGAGADTLTSCLVMEELAAGEAGIAATLAHTSMLGHLLFDQLMTNEQRVRFLPLFVADDRYHLAYARHAPDPDLGWKYQRAFEDQTVCGVSAVRQGNDWVLNGVTGFVANAPVAKLIAVEALTGPKAAGMHGVSALLVPHDTPGMTVRPTGSGIDSAEPVVQWHHGTGGELVFKDCRVAAAMLLGKEGGSPLARAAVGWDNPQIQAMNIGVGRAAYEAAIDYAKLRVQGARPIIQHQAIGTILADAAIKLEVARNMVWKAAWACDHPEAEARRSLPDLPLQAIAKVFTSEAVHEAAEGAAECFGAMGIMLDMPLAKYVRDAQVFLYWGSSNSVARFRVAEALADYRRPLKEEQ